MRLGELQAWFWDSLHARTETEPEPAEPIARQLVHGTASFSAQARLSWYAQMSHHRHLDALASEFPVLASLLGDDFGPCMQRYVRATPTPHASLGLRGETLPEFLRQAGLPGAAGLAELEWAHSLAFLAADATPIAVDVLSQLHPECFMEARLTLVPSVRRLRLDVDPTPTWRQFEAEQVLETPAAHRTHLVVWRQEERVFHVAVTPLEAMALERAANGEPLGAVCEAFAEDPRGAGAAFEALAAWFNEGWVAALQS